jgi:enamine deaminase RidA (YjgF/YER057c/UK114 family)
MSIEQRLAELGITLPEPAAPVAAYVPAVEANGLLHISGQISFAEDGSLIKGRLGENMDLEAGQAAARRCGIMLLAQDEGGAWLARPGRARRQAGRVRQQPW